MQVNPATARSPPSPARRRSAAPRSDAVFANGSYVAKQYTILNATGGVNGTFGALVNTNLPASFKTSLSYDANNAYLNLALIFRAAASFGGGLNVNQQNVGNALTNFFNAHRRHSAGVRRR